MNFNQLRQTIWLLALCLAVCSSGCNNKKQARLAPAGEDGLELAKPPGADAGEENDQSTSSDGSSQDEDAAAESAQADSSDKGENAQETEPLKEPVESFAGLEPWIDLNSLPMEAGYLQFVGTRQVGYSHVLITPPMLKSSRQIGIVRTDSVEFIRAGQRSRIETVLKSQETVTGTVLELEETTTNGRIKTSTKGVVNRGVLTLTTSVAESTKRQSVKLEPGTWGVMGVQAMLMQKPLAPGDRLTGKIFLPQLRQIVNVELAAFKPEIIALLDGSKPELLPVEVIMSVDQQNGVRSRNWVNEKGEIQKTVTLSGSSTSTFRVPIDVIRRLQNSYDIDALEEYSFPLAGELPDRSVGSIMYKVDATGVDPYTLFPESARQKVQSATARTAAVTVARLDASEFGSSEKPENIEDYLAASRYVQSDAEAIDLMAAEWAAADLQGTELAVALMDSVHKNLEKVEEFSSRFASAQEVAKSLKGDCTEHAVLLMALLRSREIPARLVTGLAAAPEGDALTIHVWTEAWVADHWLPLDPTSGQIPGTHHIKLGDTALEGENPWETVMPIVDLLGQLRFGVAKVANP